MFIEAAAFKHFDGEHGGDRQRNALRRYSCTCLHSDAVDIYARVRTATALATHAHAVYEIGVEAKR